MRPIPFTTTTTNRTPSFQIAGAASTAAPVLRLDQINSQQVLLAAKRVWFHYLQTSPMGADPLGVVLSMEAGRVVFSQPVLLPNEQFVAIDWLRGRQRRPNNPRLRMPKTARATRAATAGAIEGAAVPAPWRGELP